MGLDSVVDSVGVYVRQLEWPDWYLEGRRSPTGRYTLTTARHYAKDSPLFPAGLLGPVSLQVSMTQP